MSIEDSESRPFELNISLSVSQVDLGPTSAQELLRTWYFVFLSLFFISLKVCGTFLLKICAHSERYRNLRPFIMRSDSELLILIFRSEKKMGLLMQSDFAKSDGIKSDLRIRWPKSSDFGPKSDDSTHRIIKSKNGIGL